MQDRASPAPDFCCNFSLMIRCLTWTCACLVASALLLSCSTRLDVFTEAREAYVVYGVLNATQDTQYVKITRVFQTPGDAVAFAAENDPTVRNLLVTMESDSLLYTASEATHLPRDPGLFIPGQVIYAFVTQGSSRLIAGKNYTLRIRKPDDPDFLISASTILPGKPIIHSPRGPYTGAGGVYTWPTLDFENKQFVEFDSESAEAWEARVGFYYLKEGLMTHSVWKTLGLILPEENCGSGGAGSMCYEMPGGGFPRFIRSLTDNTPAPLVYSEEPRVTHSVDSLPHVCYVEMTAVDGELTTFLRGNEPGPFGLNLLMDKQEYSNISGDNYGIWGSIHTDSTWIFMGQCTQYLGGLTTAEPPGCSF